MSVAAIAPSVVRALSLETIGMTKIFGPLVALDDVSIKVEAGSFHALLGENGAGKSTLVKCIMGFYSADKRQVLLDGKEAPIHNPRDARALGIGMVYQHFTLVPSLTGAGEPGDQPRRRAGGDRLEEGEAARSKRFLDRMPFRVPLDVPVSTLAAGEKQKLEILKLLYLDQRLPDPRRADLGADARRGRRDARPAARHGAAQGPHRPDDHPQVPRGDRLRRRGDGAAPRQAGRRRQGRRADHRRHGAHDDRRHPDPRARGPPERSPNARRRSNSPRCSPTTTTACRRSRRSTSRSMRARSSASPACPATASRSWSRCCRASGR